MNSLSSSMKPSGSEEEARRTGGGGSIAGREARRRMWTYRAWAKTAHIRGAYCFHKDCCFAAKHVILGSREARFTESRIQQALG